MFPAKGEAVIRFIHDFQVESGHLLSKCNNDAILGFRNQDNPQFLFVFPIATSPPPSLARHLPLRWCDETGEEALVPWDNRTGLSFVRGHVALGFVRGFVETKVQTHGTWNRIVQKVCTALAPAPPKRNSIRNCNISQVQGTMQKCNNLIFVVFASFGPRKFCIIYICYNFALWEGFFGVGHGRARRRQKCRTPN